MIALVILAALGVLLLATGIGMILRGGEELEAWQLHWARYELHERSCSCPSCVYVRAEVQACPACSGRGTVHVGAMGVLP